MYSPILGLRYRSGDMTQPGDNTIWNSSPKPRHYLKEINGMRRESIDCLE